MSQINKHILSPNTEPVLTALNRRTVEKDIYVKLNKLSIARVFGIGNDSDGAWNEVILKNSILTMFDYTNAKTLTYDELKCLVGRLFKGLDSSIPCNTSGIHF